MSKDHSYNQKRYEAIGEVNHFTSYLACNGVARIFFEGATRPMPPGRFCVISRSRPDVGGGGWVVAEIFRDLHKRTRFAGGVVGGGVVAEVSIIS